MRLYAKNIDSRERVFFIRCQALEASSKSGLTYDGWSSGPIIYSYVGGNPISNVDPNGLLCFDFDKFANQVEQNRSGTAADLAALGAAGAAGTMPKTAGELRGLGVAKSDLNPYTSQLSRWAGRFDARDLRVLGRTAAGVAVSTAATGALVFDGFYNWGVIGKAAWDATSSESSSSSSSSSSGSCGCSK